MDDNNKLGDEKVEFETLRQLLRKIPKSVSTVPTYTPHSFIESFVLYDSGATQRLYIFGMDDSGTGKWYYVALT